MKRDVSSRIVLNVTEPADLDLRGRRRRSLPDRAREVHRDARRRRSTGTSCSDAHGTRLHRLQSGVGRLVVEYAASIVGEGAPAPTTETDLIVYTRPSRYAESDRSARPRAPSSPASPTPPSCSPRSRRGSARACPTSRARACPPTARPARFSPARASAATTRTCASRCCAGSASPRGSSPSTPPGCTRWTSTRSPRRWIDGAWRVVDATTLAPRSSLVRIATGRDAADTAFLTVASGRADLVEIEVSATADVLPDDDITQLVSIR